MKQFLSIFTITISLAASSITAEEQKQEPSSEVTQHMTKLSPALRNATGKKKDQLVVLCQADSMNLGDTQKVARVFNLSDEQDSATLKELLSDEENREVQGPLCVLFAAFGEQSVRWLLGYYDQASPLAKANIIHKMHYLEFKEVYEFLASALKDKTSVPNKRARATAPGRYVDERVCDYAFNKLISRLRQSGGTLPETIKLSGIGPLDPIEKRDQQINALQSYLSGSGSKEWSQLLLKKPSVKP